MEKTKRICGFTLLGLGAVLGVVAIILCVTIVGLPLGLPLLLMAVALAAPGAALAGTGRPHLRR